MQCFRSESVLTEHKKDCLSINGKQSVKLKEGTIEFENFFKQTPVPFKIYADFECNLKSVESYEGSYTKNIKITFVVVLLTKLFGSIISLVSQLLFFEAKILLMNLLKQFLRSMSTAKLVMKKHFNKNLIMSEEEEHLFQLSNSYWICEKLIDNDEEKVRDNCHVTENCRGAAHWSCNINPQLTKKVPIIFHNLRGYNSHLIFSELDKFE